MPIRRLRASFSTAACGLAHLRLVALCLLIGNAAAAEPLEPKLETAPTCKDDAMIVFDASGSMAGTDLNTPLGPRIAKVKTALGKVLPSIAAVRRIGLLDYAPADRRRQADTATTSSSAAAADAQRRETHGLMAVAKHRSCEQHAAHAGANRFEKKTGQRDDRARVNRRLAGARARRDRSYATGHSGSAALYPDKDGTVDLAEAKAAGAKEFAKLDPDKDGTLDAKELGSHVDAAALKAADPDSDGTLDEKEYASLVVARFKAADPDNDGTLDDKELGTDAGKAFLKLVE